MPTQMEPSRSASSAVTSVWPWPAEGSTRVQALPSHRHNPMEEEATMLPSNATSREGSPRNGAKLSNRGNAGGGSGSKIPVLARLTHTDFSLSSHRSPLGAERIAV